MSYGYESTRKSAKWAIFAILIVILVALRLEYIFHAVVNSDEPQHLHVAWAWTQGLIPYRDVFDNHAPLFAWLYSPLLEMLGARADIVPWMRLANIPWYLLTLWFAYRLAETLFDRQIAIAATALTAVQSTFFLKSLEFRPDVMWAALWVGAMTLAIRGALNRRRLFLVGLAMGVVACVSIKTSILLTTAAVAFAIVYALDRYRHGNVGLRSAVGGVTAWSCGAVIGPGLILIGFTLAGSFDAMRYCLFQHNLVPGLGRWSYSDSVLLRVLPALLLVPAVLLSHRWLERVGWSDIGKKRTWVFLTAVGYVVIRDCWQPLIDAQDLLPWVPIAMPFVVAALDVAIRRLNACGICSIRLAPLVGAMLLFEAVYLIVGHPFWKNSAQHYASDLSRVLSISTPGQFVLDEKGQAIFRMRPTYWNFENITLYRFAHGSIVDDVPRRLAACGIAVVFGDRWPSKLDAFIRSNYLADGDDLRIAGKTLATRTPGTRAGFTLDVPQRYALSENGGAFFGTLDGTRYTGPRNLSAGVHSVVSDRAGSIRLRWIGGGSDECKPENFAQARKGLVSADKTGNG